MLKLEGKGKNIAVIYYSAMIAATRKSHFNCFLPLGGDEVWVRPGSLTHACHSRLGRTDRGLGTFDSLVLKAALDSPKISLLIFLYRDFGE